METSELIIGGIGLLTTITSGWASWFFTRKKYNAEVDHNYIENLGKGLETYDAIISHNKAEIEYLMKENEELRKEVAELRKQVLDLTMSVYMNLTGPKKAEEHQIINKGRDGKNKSRLDETKDIS